MSAPRFKSAKLLGSTVVVALALGSVVSSSAIAATVRTRVVVAGNAGAPFTPTSITVPSVDSIRAELPKEILSKGTLVIGVGALPSGFPPLAFTGKDQQTLTGSEPDLGRLVAAVFGLTPQINNSAWPNLFVGIDSGRTDVAFTNVTDTEQRKLKYDFASYRQDNLGFEVLASSTWNFGGDYINLAGKTVSVSAGTNQEKILLQWQSQLKAAGKDLKISYYPDQPSLELALKGGRIDAYFGPNPGIAYDVSQNLKSPKPLRTAGTYSGAGATLQGLIAATTKKDNGLVKPLADAINYLIKNGQYAKWLKAYNLSNEAVPTALINPPGLPLSNS